MPELDDQNPPAPPVPPTDAPTPPWGDDFDPQRAWHTIQSLRQREAELSKQPRLTPQQQQALSEYEALVESTKSDIERAQEAATRHEREAREASAKATRYEVAIKHSIPADLVDFLGTGTPEEVEARAETIKARLIAAQVPVEPPKVQPPGTRPVVQMRGGATPSDQSNEEDADYAALFGSKAG